MKPSPPFHLLHYPLLLIAIIFTLTECKNHEDQNGTLYPKRPSGHPYYLNTSSKKNIDDVALGELQRARELTGIDFTMYFANKLPETVDPSEYAAGLFSEWKIGQKADGRGVLFLFIEETGTLKIEVGYGLEGIYPDGFVGSFQDNLKNYFVGEYFGDFVSGMITEMVNRAMHKDSLAEMKNTVSEQTLEKETLDKDSFLSGGAGTIKGGFFPDAANKLKMIRPIKAQTKAKYDQHQDPMEVIRRYVESLDLGINSPDLGLLTEGSRYMRMEYPKSEGFQRQAARDFSGPYVFTQEGDYAVARFKNASLMPLLLRKNLQGFWQIDVTKSWAYVQAAADLKSMHPAFLDHAWMFAWPEVKKQREKPRTPEPFPAEQSLADYISQMEKAIMAQPENGDLYFQLADTLYFECYWIRSAMQLIEEGLKRQPQALYYRKRLINMSYRFPDLTRVAYHYEELVSMYPNETDMVTEYIWYLKTYRPGDTKKIAELESWEKNPPLPIRPVIMDADRGFYISNYFPIPKGQKSITISGATKKSYWHEGYTPCIRILLTDSSAKHELGVQLNIPAENMAFETSLHEWPAVEGKKQPLIGSSYTLGENFDPVLEWNDQGTLYLTLNGKKTELPPLNFTTAYVKLFARSAVAVLNVK